MGDLGPWQPMTFGHLTSHKGSAMRATRRRTYRTATTGAIAALAALAVPATAEPVPGSWVSKGTSDLGDGWSAKIDVNVSARGAKAAVSLDGAVKGSLKAYVEPSTTKIDGRTFTLATDGTITREGAKPVPPNPQPDTDTDTGTFHDTAKGVAEADSDETSSADGLTPLTAVGGGIAALGAAGLGFALYRRKQKS